MPTRADTSPVMLELTVTFTNDVKIKRHYPWHTCEETLAIVHALVQNSQQDLGFHVKQVMVQDASRHVERERLKFTNIVGRIMHTGVMSKLHQPAVQPFLRRIDNKFGSFTGVFSPDTNLLTCSNNASTLFRGGHDCARILLVIEHAIKANTVLDKSVHMLVASATLGWPVPVNSHWVDKVLCNDARWHGEVIPCTEELEYIKNIRLTNFSPDFGKAHGVASPLRVVMNISQHGCVTFFMTVDNLPLEPGVEHKHMPLFEDMLSVIRSAT